MGWRDRLRQASFRGVPFKVDGIGGKVGRRLAKYQYPYQEENFIDDLGRSLEGFWLRGYVIGDDYMEQKDAIVSACSKEGPGTLVHPTLGTMTVRCEDLSFSETVDEGGMARLEFTFIEKGVNSYPRADVDTRGASLDASDDLSDISRQKFIGSFSLADAPSAVQAAAGGDVSQLAMLVAGLDMGEWSAAYAQARAVLASLSSGMSSEASSLVRSEDLASAIPSLLSAYTAAADTQETGLAGLADVGSYGRSLIATARDGGYSTSARRLEADNRLALGSYIASLSLAGQATALTGIDYPSYDDAAAARSAFVMQASWLGISLADAGDLSGYRAVSALSSAVSADLSARGGSLARVVSYRTPQSLPALVLAHRLYQDAGRADELIARNRSRHPLFMPATGVALSA